MSVASDLPLGPYRQTVIDATSVWVSTIVRESSAIEGPSRFLETMAFSYHGTEILWQSSAGGERQANRQHDLAVRWFSRPWRAAASSSLVVSP